jgi:hypothetical protein
MRDQIEERQEIIDNFFDGLEEKKRPRSGQQRSKSLSKPSE